MIYFEFLVTTIYLVTIDENQKKLINSKCLQCFETSILFSKKGFYW